MPTACGLQVVGHRGHGAVEELRKPVVGVELLPQRGGGSAARQPVDDDELLADVQAALQELGLHALQLDVALEQGLEARRVLLPQPMPERERLLGGIELALGGGLRLARVATRELGVQMRAPARADLGDGRALARREVGCRQRAQLPVHGLVQRRDGGDQQRLRPSVLRACRRRQRPAPEPRRPRALRASEGLAGIAGEAVSCIVRERERWGRNTPAYSTKQAEPVPRRRAVDDGRAGRRKVEYSARRARKVRGLSRSACLHCVHGKHAASEPRRQVASTRDAASIDRRVPGHPNAVAGSVLSRIKSS